MHCEYKGCKIKVKLLDITSLCCCKKRFCNKHKFYNNHECNFNYKLKYREKLERDINIDLCTDKKVLHI